MFRAFIIFTAVLTFLLVLTQKVHSGKAITGHVIKVDGERKVITVKIAARPVNLDISNLSLKGYKNIEEIKKNDWITILYTPYGTTIIRPLKKQLEQKQTDLEPKKTVETKKTHSRLVRVKSRGNSFSDVDNNGDKKISPVELSVVFPELTMEKFKTYDKNKDGFLDEGEFREAMKNP